VKKIDAHMHVNGGGQDFGCPVEAVIDAADRLERQRVLHLPGHGARDHVG